VICHGANGKGDVAKGIPSLAGQPPGYLRDQIQLFKQDARNPGDAALAAVKALMKTVPDERIPDLAAYYSSLR
jgi:cytochrome c553